jgi:hypothetical protein
LCNTKISWYRAALKREAELLETQKNVIIKAAQNIKLSAVFKIYNFVH